MMKLRTGWLPIGAFALVLISILAFLYSRDRGHDTSAYFENAVIVRQLKQLDARWELDVMKSRMGINPNYDALVDPLHDLTQLQGSLRGRLAGEHQGAALETAQGALNNAVSQKTRLIERFKSHNSVLRNSLFFLPTAAGDLRQESGPIGRVVDAVLLDVLVYSQSPSSDGAAEIETRLGGLAAAGKAQSPKIQDDLSIFSSHVRTVLREQPLVNGLLRTIAEVPTTARINDLDRLLSSEESRIEARVQQDRQYLLIFAAALVSLFLYAAIKLLRSHAIINRVNRQLQDVNAGLEQRVKERTQDLQTANGRLTAIQAAVRNLLDNAEQGFLTIDRDLKIGEQSSAACKTILGETPAGRSIVELLCREKPSDQASAMHATLASLFQDSSDFIRELKLGLLPAAFELGGKSIRAGYKMLGDNQLMLILTDVTETTRLAAQVERDRLRLEMVVLAFTESEAFTALTEEYREFIGTELPALLQQIAEPGRVSELYRRLHTFKGLLAQFSFHRSPQCLHGFETALSDRTSWTAQAARQVFAPERLRAEFQRDLDTIADILGPDFLASDRRLSLSQDRLKTMKQVASQALASGHELSPSVRQLLREMAALGGLDVKSALALHGRGAAALAARLDKEMGQVAIVGDTTSLEPEIYGPFLRSLVHVFRNAVDHGIETPEARLSVGKPAEGSIRCSVRHDDHGLKITIEDDGCGVDRETLEERLTASGVPSSQAAGISLENMMFREGLSSRDSADEISGRGVGLAAVKAELDRLGGSVSVETGQGAGTRLCFHVPANPNLLGHNAASLEMIP